MSIVPLVLVPQLLLALNQLAVVYTKKGDYSLAEPLQLRLLERENSRLLSQLRQRRLDQT